MKKATKPMTVADLLKALGGLPPSKLKYTVRLEGCDCYGDAGSIEVVKGTTIVDILRVEGQ